MSGPDDVGFVKAHAYGNDFLLVDEGDLAGAATDAAAFARVACHRTRGIGADGLLIFRHTADGAAMTLYNADGSHAELSGNGLRCLAALIVETRRAARSVVSDADADADADADIAIATHAGLRTLALVDDAAGQYTFRAFMGEPAGLGQREIDVGGESVAAVVLSVGNPQCIVLTPSLDDARFRRLGPALATHHAFPAGTNVAFVEVERPNRARILIWERGVGATAASGTGACASGVAAAAYGGANRQLDVVSPGGTQHVEWRDDGIYLTGWAQMTVRGHWCGGGPVVSRTD